MNFLNFFAVAALDLKLSPREAHNADDVIKGDLV